MRSQQTSDGDGKPKRRRTRRVGKPPPEANYSAKPTRGRRAITNEATPKKATKSQGNRRIRPTIPAPEPKAVEPSPSIPPEPGRIRSRVRSLAARTKKPLMFALRVAAAFAVVAGGIASWRLFDQYIHTAEAFAITAVDTHVGERVSEAELLETASLSIGQNAFLVPPEAAQANLEAHPWIASARVERRLPGSYRVRVTERRPAALLSLGELYLVDADGAVFKTVEPGDPVDFPVVTGVDEERFLRDRVTRTAVLQDVITLLHDYRSAGLYRREPISEIHVEPDDGLSLIVGEDGMQVRLGRGPWRTKLRKLRRVLDRLDAQEARAIYVLLDNARRPDRVTVRLREELPPPPEPETPAAAG